MFWSNIRKFPYWKLSCSSTSLAFRLSLLASRLWVCHGLLIAWDVFVWGRMGLGGCTYPDRYWNQQCLSKVAGASGCYIRIVVYTLNAIRPLSFSSNLDQSIMFLEVELDPPIHNWTILLQDRLWIWSDCESYPRPHDTSSHAPLRSWSVVWREQIRHMSANSVHQDRLSQDVKDV